jgi:hypothetical protein
MEKIEIKLANGEVTDNYNLYQYDNNTLLNSYNAAKERGDEEVARFILDYILGRFKSDQCLRGGETKEELFARNFGDFVNGRCGDKKRVAASMCREHRYLQNEMFKVCLEYIKALAENCEKGYYDPRNEYAAKTSKVIIDHFKEINHPY